MTVRFEGPTAVESVDDTLHQGEMLGVTGTNGTREITLVNGITGSQVKVCAQLCKSVQ